MRLYTLTGSKQIYKNVSKFLIKWDGKSRSGIQFKTKQFLKKYWLGQIVYEEFPVFGSLLKVDIFNATKKLAVEVNGKQHSAFNPFFHDNSRTKYLNGIKRDYAKAQWLDKNGFTLIEIEEDEVKDLTKDFFKTKFNVDL